MSSNSAKADNTIPPSTTPGGSASMGDFDSICKDSFNNQNSAANDAPANQKLQYCTAAQTAVAAYTANSITWKVWAGVAGVCTAACMAPYAVGASNQWVCQGVNLAGAAADYFETKTFMTALMAIGTGGMGYMTNMGMNPSPEKEKKPPNPTDTSNGPAEAAKTESAETEAKQVEKDWGACLIAATAAFQAFTSHSTMTSSQKTAEASLTSAKACMSSTAPPTTSSLNTSPPPIQTANQSANSTTGLTGQPIINTQSQSIASKDQNLNPCTAAASSLNAGLMTQCAIATNSNIPSFTSGPGFLTDFKKAAGLDFPTFAQQSTSPGQALMTAMAGSVSPTQTAPLATALTTLGHQVPAVATTSLYGSGGGGMGPKRSGGGEAFNMKDMMEQLMGKKPDDAQRSNSFKTLIFANQTRSATGIAEDKTFSLFDRITYRYYFVGRELVASDVPNPSTEKGIGAPLSK